MDRNLEILKKRAKKLAQTKNDTINKANSFNLIEFLLNDERYAIESCYAREVYLVKDFTPLPCVPSFIKGLINVRRNILPLISLKHYFEFRNINSESLSVALILKDQDNELAVLIDSIVGVTTVQIEDLQQTLPTLTGKRQQCLKGIDGNQLIVLDGQKLLLDPNFLLEEQVKT